MFRHISFSFLASATRDSGVAVKLGGAWGGFWYLSGAMVTDVAIGLVDVQLVGRGVVLVGLTCLNRAVNRDPMRREGARMNEMPVKRRAARRISRSREGIARLKVYQASPPGVL